MSDRKIDAVVARTDCKKHDAERDQVCFTIIGDTRYFGGVCGARAKRAGFVGVPKKKSTGNKRPR